MPKAIKDYNCMDCDEPITKKQWDQVAVCEKCMYRSTKPKKIKRRREDERDSI